MGRGRREQSVVEEAVNRSAGAGRRVQLGPDQIVREDWETDRAILVGLAANTQDIPQQEESLAELSELSMTAGADPVAFHLQVRSAPSAATYVGKGKVEEIRDDANAHDATLVVFDDDLTPAQQRNLEQELGGRRVLDRTQLILDIFAQHATTREGKIQVELAQLRYRLPRLGGRGLYLSRLGGGIGTRGPGETILEVDRRRIGRRIAQLKRELEEMSKTRRVKRARRGKGTLPQIALVGYTNAGKSSLLNRLCGAEVLVADKLFSTLDTTVRRVALDSGRVLLFGDTVGFVRKLPHELVRAFHSTLEEVAEADLLLHVVDASSSDPGRNVRVVRDVLVNIGATCVPELIVWNKTDISPPELVRRLLADEPGSVAVSARTGEGGEALLETVLHRIDAGRESLDLLIPFSRGEILHALHLSGDVLEKSHSSQGTRVLVRLPRADAARFREFVVQGCEKGLDLETDLDTDLEASMLSSRNGRQDRVKKNGQST